MKKKLKKKYFIILILLIIFIYTFFNLLIWFIDINNNKNLYNNLNNNVINKQKDKKAKEKELVTIDFNKLIEINNDIIGWIIYSDKINYPIVQTNNNDYYLKKSFNKENNTMGSIFMDYKNNHFNDLNIVIYGHNTIDKTMFGSLRDTLKKDFFNNSNNNYIYIYTKDKNMKYLIFSVYVIDGEIYYATINPIDYKEFIKTITKRSVHNFKINVNMNDKILTLSTCYGNRGTTKRMVIHAKLIDESDE